MQIQFTVLLLLVNLIFLILKGETMQLSLCLVNPHPMHLFSMKPQKKAIHGVLGNVTSYNI